MNGSTIEPVIVPPCVHAELMLPDAFNNGGIDMLIHASPPGGNAPNSKAETPNVKKRHRRAKSGTNKTEPGQDGGGFSMRVGQAHQNGRTGPGTERCS